MFWGSFLYVTPTKGQTDFKIRVHQRVKYTRLVFHTVEFTNVVAHLRPQPFLLSSLALFLERPRGSQPGVEVPALNLPVTEASTDWTLPPPIPIPSPPRGWSPNPQCSSECGCICTQSKRRLRLSEAIWVGLNLMWLVSLYKEACAYTEKRPCQDI